MTVLSGSLPHPELEAVMLRAESLRQHAGTGNYSGETHCPNAQIANGFTALVTSGAAAAIQSGLAGILGDNETLIKSIA
jgi:hypothetical protein